MGLDIEVKGGWRINAFLFLLTGSQSVLLPWSPVILRTSGLSASSVGVIMGVLTLVGSTGVLGCMAGLRRTHSGAARRLMLLLLTTCTVAFHIFAVLLLPASADGNACIPSSNISHLAANINTAILPKPSNLPSHTSTSSMKEDLLDTTTPLVTTTPTAVNVFSVTTTGVTISTSSAIEKLDKLSTTTSTSTISSLTSNLDQDTTSSTSTRKSEILSNPQTTLSNVAESDDDITNSEIEKEIENSTEMKFVGLMTSTTKDQSSQSKFSINPSFDSSSTDVESSKLSSLNNLDHSVETSKDASDQNSDDNYYDDSYEESDYSEYDDSKLRNNFPFHKFIGKYNEDNNPLYIVEPKAPKQQPMDDYWSWNSNSASQPSGEVEKKFDEYESHQNSKPIGWWRNSKTPFQEKSMSHVQHIKRPNPIHNKYHSKKHSPSEFDGRRGRYHNRRHKRDVHQENHMENTIIDSSQMSSDFNNEGKVNIRDLKQSIKSSIGLETGVSILLILGAFFGTGIEMAVSKLWHCYIHGYDEGTVNQDILQQTITHTFQLTVYASHKAWSGFTSSVWVLGGGIMAGFVCMMHINAGVYSILGGLQFVLGMCAVFMALIIPVPYGSVNPPKTRRPLSLYLDDEVLREGVRRLAFHIWVLVNGLLSSLPMTFGMWLIQDLMVKTQGSPVAPQTGAVIVSLMFESLAVHIHRWLMAHTGLQGAMGVGGLALMFTLTLMWISQNVAILVTSFAGIAVSTSLLWGSVRQNALLLATVNDQEREAWVSWWCWRIGLGIGAAAWGSCVSAATSIQQLFKAASFVCASVSLAVATAAVLTSRRTGRTRRRVYHTLDLDMAGEDDDEDDQDEANEDDWLVKRARKEGIKL